jgi:hypothetical protein
MVALVDLRGRGAGAEVSEQQLVRTASTPAGPVRPCNANGEVNMQLGSQEGQPRHS